MLSVTTETSKAKRIHQIGIMSYQQLMGLSLEN